MGSLTPENSGLSIYQWFIYGIWSLIILIIILTTRQAIKTYFIFKSFEKYNLPGPKPTILFGNMLQLIFNNLRPYDTIGQWLEQYGDVYKYFMAQTPILVIKDAFVIKEIMTREFQNFPSRLKFSGEIKPFCYSVLLKEGQKWKDQRSVLTPAFSGSKMKLMSSLMNQQTDNFVRVLREKYEAGVEVEMVDQFSALTLDVIAACALALEVDCQGNANDEFFLAVKAYMRFASNPVTKMGYVLPFLVKVLVFINNYLTGGKMTDMIVRNLRQAINDRRKDTNNRRMDLLQLMLDQEYTNDPVDGRKSKGLSDDEIVANAYIFILAGYDTTGNALSFTTYLLAMNQDVQEKLYQEIIANISNEKPSYEDVHGLVYLEQVISESLRYYPPVVMFVTRECVQDVTIGDIVIPKEAVVMAPVYQLHHDPRYWTNPEKFDPERFSKENKGKIVTGSYLPFGIGPRNCVGIRFAQLEMKLALVKMIREFRLVPCSKTEDPLELICPTVIITAKNGIYLKLEKR